MSSRQACKTQRSVNDMSKYLDLLRQKECLDSFVPKNKKHEMEKRKKLEYVKKLISLYRRKLKLPNR